jgi:hypothetical protein
MSALDKSMGAKAKFADQVIVLLTIFRLSPIAIFVSNEL